jgi:hypothetical protein
MINNNSLHSLREGSSIVSQSEQEAEKAKALIYCVILIRKLARDFGADFWFWRGRISLANRLVGDGQLPAGGPALMDRFHCRNQTKDEVCSGQRTPWGPLGFPSHLRGGRRWRRCDRSPFAPARAERGTDESPVYSGTPRKISRAAI